MKTYKYGKNIYPDVDDDFKRALEIFEKYEIQFVPLFDSGIAFNYPEEKYEILEGDGLIFLNSIDKSQLLKIVECFEELDILNSDDTIIGKINLLEEVL